MTYVIFQPAVCRKNDGGTFVLEKPFHLLPQNDSSTDDRTPLMRGRSHSISLVDVILGRRSIRRFEQKEIPKDILDRILEAGRQAPSAANRQPWHFIVLTDDRIKGRLSKWLFTKHIKNSSVTIVGCANTGLLDRRWSTIGTSIALQNMVIAAWAMGVGSCWIGGFKENEVKKLLGISDKWKVVALVSFGYPSEKPHAKRRKPIEKIVGYNKF